MKGKTIIIIRDHLDERWKDWFDGMEINYVGDNTVITGNLKDETHMHGILNQIRDLNLKIISLNLADKQNDNNSTNNK